ncbi:type II toxin-antitoxin system RelE/ParE family toxin [Pusillimonas sp. SM2304]|uniref:type II toxin-antitoxin system RelE/ParE family toxin n=1 Tax=Pusillimonas sp. SM2304 TaxID=3073241 RepID=UPI0028761738|nr:type II toxin-antitoxin system RelE/ParE family toxin [Pusillimonas sp. SM2304]MDS1140634.1 type II toxin-antitoxin system RelE/ParE family toxin [Pusillimonas sp. SM2304]
MNGHYALTTAAESDTREIIRYTRQHWGDAQVRRYIETLEEGISRLALGRGTFKDMSTIYPGLRMAHIEHHYVFCLARENAPALIVAVFHERMDLMTRLTSRLKRSD